MPDLDERALTEAAKALEPFGGFIATRSKTLAREAITSYLAALPEPPLDEWLVDCPECEGEGRIGFNPSKSVPPDPQMGDDAPCAECGGDGSIDVLAWLGSPIALDRAADELESTYCDDELEGCHPDHFRNFTRTVRDVFLEALAEHRKEGQHG